MDFKDRIRALRLSKGLSTSQLGAVMGKSEGAVRSWETGKAKPDAETLIKLARYFECSIDYLLGVSSVRSISKIDSVKNEIESITRSIAELDKEINEIVTKRALLQSEIKKCDEDIVNKTRHQHVLTAQQERLEQKLVMLTSTITDT